MPSTTVNDAFRKFMIHAVRLEPGSVSTARSSRAWLIEQINKLPGVDSSFPIMYADAHMNFGSFERRTKCRTLDDIDIIIAMAGNGGHYQQQYGKTCDVFVPDDHRLAPFRSSDGTVNSRLVINQFLRSLRSVPQYSNAEMKRNQSAAILNLSSYTWVYDIVPAFFTSPEWDGRTYYLIPDGEGRWMKTDPRIDKSNATDTNQQYGKYVLDAIRITKLWIKRKRGLNLPSYLVEVMILNYYKSTSNDPSKFMDVEIDRILRYLSNNVTANVSDPKNIDSNINGLTWDERRAAASILTAAATDSAAARAEEQKSEANSIKMWKNILGDDFAEY